MTVDVLTDGGASVASRAGAWIETGLPLGAIKTVN